jgi:hypothetical protein
LFLGFSLTDPNITQIFRLARLYTPNMPRPHYVVLSKPDPAHARLEELRLPDLARVGVRVVEIGEHRDLETVLARLVARCRPTRAYMSGSVSDDDPERERITAFAVELGKQLAPHPDVRLMTGGALGGQVGYAMCEERLRLGTYVPDDFVVIRRPMPTPMQTPPNSRLGSVTFQGTEAEGLRSAAFAQVRAIVVIRGGDRTTQEIADAKALGYGVIAVGATGGPARTEWERQMADPSAYRLGERDVEVGTLQLLVDSDPAVVAQATVKLLRQALFLA